MAVRAAIATGNFTDAATWGLVDSTSYLNAENATESLLTTAYSGTRSAAFTPGAIVVSHIGVKLCERIGTTGTISVHLVLSSDFSEVAGTEVTINVADLPSALEADLNGGWVFFKLSSPVTLAAATAYRLEAKTSSATQVDLWCDATVDNLSRALITTTTGAPAAGDDLIVAGEKTGAGTGNAFTVTMNQTATTDYGAAPTAANSLIAPGLAICHGGTLSYGTTAATNYYLKMSNSVIVYSGGTLNIGTTGTPIPRDSTAVLEFDPGADGDYGLLVRNLGTCVIQGLSRSSGKNFIACLLNTDEAANSTSLGVNTDTGWLDNDEIVVTSTTRTATQTEIGALNGAAGASSLTVDGFAGAGGGLLNAHSGTSPTQAEVVLLTRNVRIRSATSTIMAYVYVAPTAQADFDWADFRYMGEAVATKRGIEVATTSGSFNMQYCTIRDCEDFGFYRNSSTHGAATVSNNVFYNLNTVAGTSSDSIHYTLANGQDTFTNNYCIDLSSQGSIAPIELADSGLNFSGNTIVSFQASVAAVRLTEVGGILGIFDDNNIHSSAGLGFQFSGNTYAASAGSTPSSFAGNRIWRCSNTGLTFGASVKRINFDALEMFGNASQNFGVSSGISITDCNFIDCLVSGDSSFSTGVCIGVGGASFFVNVNMYNCEFGVAGGIKTTHTTADISVSAVTTGCVRIVMNNCSLGSATEVLNQTNMSEEDYIKMERKDSVDGAHRTLLREGTIYRETTTVHTGSQSVGMSPIIGGSASNKLDQLSFKVAVASGATLTPSVFVYEDASYNGARARLILRRNDAIGVDVDTVIDTATAASDGAWEELTGTTPAAIDDGVMEFYVDCNGSTGNVFVDSFTVA